MAFNLSIRTRRADDDEPLYSASVAAQLARVSLELLRQCEEESLIRPRAMAGGGLGYSAADIRRLIRIRRLQDDLELDLPAVEVVLHMRRQVLDLMAELDELERQMWRRERLLLAEMQRLRRRVADEAEW